MSISATIAGITRKFQFGSYNVKDNINARSTADFTVLYTKTDPTPIDVGQEVIIWDGATKIFAGQIDEFDEMYLQGPDDGKPRLSYDCKCVDFNQIVDRRRVFATYENKTVQFILDDLVTKFLAAEGISLGTVDFGSTLVEQAVFNYITMGEVLQFITSLVPALNWNVDFDKQLHVFDRTNTLGPEINDSNVRKITRNKTRQELATRVYVEAGDSTTEILTNEIPSPKPDGESRVFTTRFPLATKPSIRVDLVAVADSDIGILGVETGKKWYWQKGSRNISQDTSETVLSDTQSIDLSYQGLKPIRVVSNDPGAQAERAASEGGTGLYERSERQPQIDTKAGARQYGDGILSKYGQIRQQITVISDTPRTAGTLVPIVSDQLGINAEMLISDVTYSEKGNCAMQYVIVGSIGSDLGTWVEFFRELTQKETVTFRENEVLVQILSFTEIESHKGTVTIKTFEPPVVDEEVICDDDLICGGDVISEVIKYD